MFWVPQSEHIPRYAGGGGVSAHSVLRKGLGLGQTEHDQNTYPGTRPQPGEGGEGATLFCCSARVRVRAGARASAHPRSRTGQNREAETARQGALMGREGG